jgi:hypothetical protein
MSFSILPTIDNDGWKTMTGLAQQESEPPIAGGDPATPIAQQNIAWICVFFFLSQSYALCR